MDSNSYLNITNKAVKDEKEVKKLNEVIDEKVMQNLSKDNINNKKIIDIKRDAMDWDDFKVKYKRLHHKEIPFNLQIKNLLIKSWKEFSIISCLTSLFPIIKWLPKYKLKTELLLDFIAGLTISIFHILQGMAHSLNSGLDAVHGLYVSFFPALIYALMGTSHHISVGTFAIVSLMSSNIATKLGSVSSHATNVTTNQTLSNDWPPTTLQALTTVCFVIGFIHIAMGFLCLGKLSLILSDHLVSGFSTAIAFHIATAQMNNILGLSIPKLRTGRLKIIRTWVKILRQFHLSNPATIIFSLIIITILSSVKQCIEPQIQMRLSLPIPIDLLVVIFSILSSWIFKFDQKFSIKIVGNITIGLPEPTVPRFDLIPEIFIDCLIIAIVSYTVSLSVAKIFAKKHGYEVDPNQELIALGTANVISSYFMSYPASVALSRSAIQETTGGKTQIASLFSCGVILTFLLLWAPFLYHLPKSTLSCIIIIALKDMFLQIFDFKKIWIDSKLDATSWLVTLLSVIFLDVDLGLIIGISFSTFVILLRLVKPKTSLLGSLPSTEIYVDLKNYSKVEEINGIKIFRFSSPIFYLTIENFKSELLNITHKNEKFIDENKFQPKPEILIIDLSCVPFVDRTGVETIVDLIEKLKEQNVSVCLVSCSTNIIDFFERTNFLKNLKNNCIYPTIHDAVINLK